MDCTAEKLELVKTILHEGDMFLPEELEDMIFRFGSMIREKDYVDRELFVYLVEKHKKSVYNMPC